MDGYLLLAEAICREGVKDHLELVKEISVYGWWINKRYYNATYGIYSFVGALGLKRISKSPHKSTPS